MKLIAPATAVLFLLAPLPIIARSLTIFGSGQSPIKAANKDFPVDGENPLTYCYEPTDNILEIESVDLSPNPPVPYVSPASFIPGSNLVYQLICADGFLVASP
jgi:hypothetical protein